ncbi:MAG: DnaA ATPase domain-containing protein [Rhabdochlamydiaceae bacterium]
MKKWEEFLSEQKNLLGSEVSRKWLTSLRLISFDDKCLHLETENFFHLNWVKEHLSDRLKKEIKNTHGKPVKIKLTVKGASPKIASSSSPQQINFSIQSDPLVSSYSFDNFYPTQTSLITLKFFQNWVNEGLKEPVFFSRNTYNPIHLYGPSGSGKTHLLNALALCLKKQQIEFLYVTANSFTNHFVSAIRTDKVNEFRSVYRRVQVLIVDDVHELAGRYATQEEFFHTFNHLYGEKKSIFLASTSPPSGLKDIEARLVSRLEWGLSFNLAPPSRTEIKDVLIKKSNALSLGLNEDSCQFILTNFLNIKSALKALDTLILRCHIDKIPFSELCEQKLSHFLQDLLKQEKKTIINPSTILSIISKYYQIEEDQILGRSKEATLVKARQLCMYLFKEKLEMSYPKIAKFFNKDHSTVISSVKKVKENEEDYLEMIERFERE